MRAALTAALLFGPAIASACPVCARDEASTAVLLVAGMIAAPYLVAAVVIRAIRGGGTGP